MPSNIFLLVLEENIFLLVLEDNIFLLILENNIFSPILEDNILSLILEDNIFSPSLVKMARITRIAFFSHASYDHILPPSRLEVLVGCWVI